MNHNKSSIFARGIHSAAIIGGLFLTAGSSFAATSGNVAVSGEVVAVNEITVTAQTGYNTLDLSTTATDQVVAIVNEKNNDANGYTVTLASASAVAATSAQAQLVAAGNNGANSEAINYSLKYGGVAVTLVSGSATVTSTTAATAQAGADKNLAISFTGAWHNADTYSDTVTLTIAAK